MPSFYKYITDQCDAAAVSENRRIRGRPKKDEISPLVRVEMNNSARNVSWAVIYALKELELDPNLVALFLSHKQELEHFLIGDLAVSD